MKDLSERLEKEINDLALVDSPKDLYDPIRHVLAMGGKRLRPQLVLLGYGLGEAPTKAPSNSVYKAALAVELFHNFTLLHDDIMDRAPLRRGRPTVHKKWNEATAILSGDAMMVKAYELMCLVPKERLLLALQKFNACALSVCEGQQLDMNFEKQDLITEEKYMEMIRLKTAVLIGFSLECGGLLAGEDATRMETLHAIGTNAGIGFQLMDDLLDAYADKDKFGKQIGGDIASNKKTFLLIKAWELARPSQRKELSKWMESSDAEAKVGAIKNIYDEIGIYAITHAKMNFYYDRAFSLLDGLGASKEGKQNLETFFRKLMKRER